MFLLLACAPDDHDTGAVAGAEVVWWSADYTCDPSYPHAETDATPTEEPLSATQFRWIDYGEGGSAEPAWYAESLYSYTPGAVIAVDCDQYETHGRIAISYIPAD